MRQRYVERRPTVEAVYYDINNLAAFHQEIGAGTFCTLNTGFPWLDFTNSPLNFRGNRRLFSAGDVLVIYRDPLQHTCSYDIMSVQRFEAQYEPEEGE